MFLVLDLAREYKVTTQMKKNISRAQHCHPV